MLARKETGESYAKLGARFGFSTSQAFRICTGKSRSEELAILANDNDAATSRAA